MHAPVMVGQVLRYLAPERGGVFVDCTVGLGGHATAILEASADARLVGIDRDPAALEIAAQTLQPFAGRFQLVQGRFRDLPDHLEELGLPAVSGILADLGVSSMQLDTPERGFSFRFEGPLDMRMGDAEQSARDIVNHYSEGDLERIFREYGEEVQARRVARTIAEARVSQSIETTTELRSVVARAKRGGSRGHRRIDPATKVFQALRVEVNKELSDLKELMDRVADLLESDGRLVVISYHSLEDRIVKQSLRQKAQGEVDPITGRTRSESRVIELLTRKPLRPSEEEVVINPRARSARLRAGRRL